MSGDVGALPECVVKILMIPDHIAFQIVGLGRIEPELVGLQGRPYLGTPREGSGSLSRQPVECTQWCSTDESEDVEEEDATFKYLSY